MENDDSMRVGRALSRTKPCSASSDGEKGFLPVAASIGSRAFACPSAPSCADEPWYPSGPFGLPLGKDELIERDEYFMRLAIDQAKRASAAGEVPIGAVVACQNEAIAEACNHREADCDPSAHAEFSAVLQAARELERWRLPDCTVYVTLEPCIMCAGLMHQARIGRCVFGAADAKAGALGSLYRVHADERLNHAFSVTPGVLEDECATLLKDFFALRRAGKGEGEDGL